MADDGWNEELERLKTARDRFSSAMLADNTAKSYADSWMRFRKWCHHAALECLPATSETVALWATSMLTAGLRSATVENRVSGVVHMHRVAGLPSPINDEVRALLSGARRLRKESRQHKRALTPAELWKISRLTNTATARGLRDRAIIVLGFAGAFRRSELSALDLADVTFVPKGLLVVLRWSKPDQEAHGRVVGVWRGENEDTCPVRTLQAWIDCRGTSPGPLFCAIWRVDRVLDRRLGADGVVRAVKRGVEELGLDPHQYGGHSLRAGFCTAAAEAGATEISIMQRTGHKSVEMVHRYVRPVEAFTRNPLDHIL